MKLYLDRIKYCIKHFFLSSPVLLLINFFTENKIIIYYVLIRIENWYKKIFDTELESY